jgi:hypothetical protein
MAFINYFTTHTAFHLHKIFLEYFALAKLPNSLGNGKPLTALTCNCKYVKSPIYEIHLF